MNEELVIVNKEVPGGLLFFSRLCQGNYDWSSRPEDAYPVSKDTYYQFVCLDPDVKVCTLQYFRQKYLTDVIVELERQRNQVDRKLKRMLEIRDESFAAQEATEEEVKHDV